MSPSPHLKSTRARVIATLLSIVLPFSLSSSFADGQKIKSELEKTHWWAEKATAVFPRDQFTLISTNSVLQSSASGNRTIMPPNSAAPDLYWRTDGTNGMWTMTNWSNPATPTGGTAWAAGNDAFFTANSSVTFVTNTLFGDVTLSPGIVVSVSQAGTASAGSHVYDIGAGSTLEWASQNFAAAGTSFTKTGSGTWNIGAIANAYTGGFTLDAGTVVVSGQNSFGNGVLTINGGAILQSNTSGVTFAASSLLIGGDFTLGTSSGSGSSTWIGTVDLGSATRAITNNGTGMRTFSGVVSNGGLIFAGTGTTVLSAANDYTGGTTVSNGTLQLSGSGTLGSTSGSLTVNGGTLNLGGTSQTIGALNGSGGTINTSTGASTLTMGTGGATGAYSGTIANGGGSVALTKTGSGIQTLSGTNNYTGATAINGGTLLINGNQSSATGAVTVTNSGSMLGGTGTIGGNVTVNSDARLQGGDGTAGTTLTLAGALTLNDASIIQLALGPSGLHSTLAHTGAGGWTFDSDQAFTFINLGAQAGTYDNIITGLNADPGTTGSWTITNPGFTGTFSYGGGNIDFNLTAVPEPSTWIAGALAIGVVGWSQRRRLFKKLKVVG